jgi:hypothetical protein
VADLLRAADVARIEPQAVDARIDGGQGQAMIEMDVGDERDAGAAPDRGQGGRGSPVRDGQPDDLGPGPGQAADLRDGRPHIPGVGLGHGLDDDGRAGADGHAADLDPAGLPAREHPALLASKKD